MSDPKLIPLPDAPAVSYATLDRFTHAYIECALWSSTEYAFGPCPCCGKPAVLSHLPEPEFTQDPMCSAEGCGVREISNREPMDRNYSASDIAPECLARMAADCANFQDDNRELLDRAQYGHREYTDAEMAGHDFWLTRCGHGAGFWDRDLPDDVKDPLTALAMARGNVDLYVGDDGKIYCSPV